MALSRIGKFQNLSILSRTHGATSSLGEIHHSNQNRIESLHVSRVFRYPEAPALPLPTNVSEIFANETGRFTPERVRDTTSPVLLYSSSNHKQFSARLKELRASFDVNNSNWTSTSQQDSHVASYDCFGAVSLNSSMQTNVPQPFNSTGKSTYLNMPGGQWARDGKYIAEDMQKSHFKFQLLKHNNKNGFVSSLTFLNSLIQLRNYTTGSNGAKHSNAKESRIEFSETEKPKLVLSKKEKFRIMVKDYGKTLTVFHIGISLLSLGGFYAAVSSGMDMTKVATVLSENDNELVKKIMVNSSTFAVAYGVHKLFAPVRLAITMTVVPFLVRYLRRKGILKHPEITKKIKKARMEASESSTTST